MQSWIIQVESLGSLDIQVGGVPNLKGENGEKLSGSSGDGDLAENIDQLICVLSIVGLKMIAGLNTDGRQGGDWDYQELEGIL